MQTHFSLRGRFALPFKRMQFRRTVGTRVSSRTGISSLRLVGLAIGRIGRTVLLVQRQQSIVDFQ
jgi:hypothetical protein